MPFSFHHMPTQRRRELLLICKIEVQANYRSIFTYLSRNKCFIKRAFIYWKPSFGQMGDIKRRMTKRPGQQSYSPHTKPSGLTAKMLLPFSSWGWAQLAFTKLWKWFSATHWGSHFSWQSHKRLDVFKCLRRVITFNLFCMRCRFVQVNWTQVNINSTMDVESKYTYPM